MPLFVLLALWISHAVSETLRPGENFTLYTKNFYEFSGAEITLKGSYEFCNPTYCPRCIRVMYLKFDKLATCSGGRDPSKLRNCWKYNFAVKATVPMKYGFYSITAHSLLHIGVVRYLTTQRECWLKQSMLEIHSFALQDIVASLPLRGAQSW